MKLITPEVDLGGYPTQIKVDLGAGPGGERTMSGDAWDAAKEKMDCSNVDVGAFSPVDIMYAIDALKEPGSIEEFHEHMDYGVNEEAMATEEPQPNPECSIGLDELTNFLIANQ